MNEKYMKIAYNESLKCLRSGDVPVGAVLVMNNKIIIIICANWKKFIKFV